MRMDKEQVGKTPGKCEAKAKPGLGDRKKSFSYGKHA
jgi:hypothetical protein